jgi:hypothetical protein
VRQEEAHVVVRFNPATLRTCDEKRRRIYLAEKEAEVPKVGAIEFKITIPVPPDPTRSHKTWNSAKAIAWMRVRAIAARTRTGEVTWVLTTLPSKQMPAIGILGLYRVRWQIAAAPRYAAVSRRTDRQELDAGANDRGRVGATLGATYWSTFPLGLRVARKRSNLRARRRTHARIAPGRAFV